MSRYADKGDQGRPPEDLTPWLRAGMRRTEALAWRWWNFSLAEAQSWRTAGVEEALTAAQWQTAGVTTATVDEWRKAGIDAAEAVHWHEFGIGLPQAREYKKQGRGPEQAFSQQRGTHLSGSVAFAASGRAGAAGVGGPSLASIHKLREAGVPHNVIGSYLQLQWFDDEAVGWAREGITAWDARQWKDLGLYPDEAALLEKAKQTARDVVREWWSAGIPFAEVADWLGAGLSPQEAVEQQAAGKTAEHAAALRALRRGGAL
jgi:hypothetical protein